MKRCRQVLVLAAMAAAIVSVGAPRARAARTVTLPPEAASRLAGTVDLAASPDGNVFGALKGLGSAGYFGAAGFDGSMSPSSRFGAGGYTAPLVLPWEGFNPEAEAEAVAVEPRGGVLVAGYAREGIRKPTSFSPLLARYTASGTLDSSFGAGGVVASRPPGDGGIVYHDVAVRSDGMIIAVGGRNEYQRGVGAPAGVVDVYRPDGSFDTSFGQEGRVLLAGRPNPNYTSLWGAELLPGDKVLVAGYLNHRMLLARLLADGQLDREFGGDGEVTVDLHSGTCCPPAALAVGPDGRIVVAARGGSYRRQRVFLARFRPNGGLDRSFGKRGVEAPFLPWRLSDANGLAVQPNGSIVTVGRSEKTKRNHRSAFALFRNRLGGAPDRSFGKEGLASVRVGRESSAGAALTLDDGSVLVGGSALFAPGGSGARTELLLDRLPPSR